MEQTKLTVRLPRDLVEGAKRYAADHDTTLTRLVSEYFRQLGVEDYPLADAPIVRRLSGILAQEVTIDGYHKYLEEKHGGQPSSLDRP
jgi:Family of unknown function (DUF6364)